ncbi:hypothetical protein ABZW30_33235 [Kitasatospora sp. NPDC004669]|uniref:hypothetical protein n=1 Tax=Kitasatospora sp. NPDC004669 TaxID=3154555 RepID=UPI0033BADC05
MRPHRLRNAFATHETGAAAAAAAATGLGDRAAVERAVRAAYRAAGLAEPTAVRWFRSPLAARRSRRRRRRWSCGPRVR